MADLPIPGQPQQPGSPQGAPGAPSIGSAPSPSAVPNQGQSAAGLVMLSVLQKGMVMALSAVGPSSPAGVDVRKSLDLISKHVPAGSVNPAQEANFLKAMLMKLAQNQPQVQQMQGMAQRQMAGAPQQPPGGAQPQPAPQPQMAA